METKTRHELFKEYFESCRKEENARMYFLLCDADAMQGKNLATANLAYTEWIRAKTRKIESETLYTQSLKTEVNKND